MLRLHSLELSLRDSGDGNRRNQATGGELNGNSGKSSWSLHGDAPGSELLGRCGHLSCPWNIESGCGIVERIGGCKLCCRLRHLSDTGCGGQLGLSLRE